MSQYVITGGPCVGKTTVVEGLQGRGYAIVPEVARVVIEAQLKLSAPIVPWTDLIGFQRLVATRQMELESRVGEGITFSDRSSIDGLAYCAVGNIQPPRETIVAASAREYAGVFVLDPLPYKQDAERREPPEVAARIHNQIISEYQKAGYHVHRIPLCAGISERVDYVESLARKLEKQKRRLA